MLDHLGYAVSDLRRSRAFYERALKPLGLAVIAEIPADKNPSGGAALGFGSDNNPFFWIGDNERVGQGTHVAFTAATRAEVDAFHRAALAAGGKDHGAPGLRPQYHPNYYAAFVLDPDGVNVEAVCHRADG